MTADLTDPSTQTFLSSLSPSLWLNFRLLRNREGDRFAGGSDADMGSGRRQQDPRHRLPLDAHELEFRLSLQVVGGRKLLPYWDSMESKEMTEFFRELAEQPDWRKTFFNARIARLPEDEGLSYDSTRIATEAVANPYAQCGKEEGGYQKQVGLALLLGHKTGMPVLYRMFPGQIADVSTVADMLLGSTRSATRRKSSPQ